MDTIISQIRRQLEDHPGKIVIRYKRDMSYKDISSFDLLDTLDSLSYAILSLGIKIGDRVAIMSENRPEWVYADLAALSCGAVTVPIYPTETAKDIEYILKDSEAEVIFVSDQEKLDKVLSVCGNTSIRRIISFSKTPDLDPLVTILDRFIAIGKKDESRYKGILEQRREALTSEDLVTIIYTSGSTGPPKGVMLSNGNFLSNCRTCAEQLNITDKDTYLSFLPLSHVFERIGGYYAMLLCGAQIAYVGSKETISLDARLVRPTIMYGVPRFFEKVYTDILNKAIIGTALKRSLFFWGYNAGRACLDRKLSNKRVPFYLSLQKSIITKPISEKMKKAFGGRLRYFVSGGAPLSKEIAYFFMSFDIPILEGYGLTESSAVISVNTIKENKIGTVGKPIPGVTVKIAPDGEILARGPGIMKGYFKSYDEAESSVKDGWLYTGDVGRVDEDGYLVITDRKKDIIVTSGGKNIAPSEIEILIKADRYIEDVLIYGDKRKFISALIIPDFKNLERYAKNKDISYGDLKELVKKERIHDFIRRRVDAKQEDLPEFARIKRFIILDEALTLKRGELTPTLKIKRKVVTEKYKEALDKLYEEVN